MSTQDEEEEFLKEIEMLQNVGTHNNIVRFLGCCTLQRPYFMVMEYVGRGDLVSAAVKNFLIFFNDILHFFKQLSYLRKVREDSTKLKQKNNANYKNFRSSARPTEQNEIKLKYLELKMSSTQSIDSENESTTRAAIPSFAESMYSKSLQNILLIIYTYIYKLNQKLYL